MSRPLTVAVFAGNLVLSTPIDLHRSQMRYAVAALDCAGVSTTNTRFEKAPTVNLLVEERVEVLCIVITG